MNQESTQAPFDADAPVGEAQADTSSTDAPTTEGAATEATGEAKAEDKPAAKPRLPKLTLTHGGVEQPLLKYPFPVKAARYAVTINGEPAEAATTAGRGKAYTYLLFKNTSFYVPGVIPADSALSVNFPADYKFDDSVIARVSNYKPKKPKAPKADGSPADASASASAGGDAGTAASSESGAGEPAAQTPEQAAVADAPKAARRKK